MITSAMLLFFILCTPVSYAGEGANAGFVNGLWFSRSPFFAGDTVRLYAALQNNSGFDIKGEATFFDKNEKIGKADFSVVNGRLFEVWTDWRVAEGSHTVSVAITKVFKVEVGRDPQPITLAFPSFAQAPLLVDKDTDGDGIGDRNDTDDDNDGLSDAEEKKYGTNPTVADSDRDGVSDKKEISAGTNPLKQPQKEHIQNSDTSTSTISLPDTAGTAAAFLKEARQQYAPRIAQATKNIIEVLDKRADNAAKIIRTKKDNLEPTQYQSLFSVSLALLLSLVEHWRIAAGVFAVTLLWLLPRRLRR